MQQNINERIEAMKQEKVQNEEEQIQKIDSSISLEKNTYETGMIMGIVNENGTYKMNHMISIKDKILLSLSKEQNLEKMVELMSSVKFKRIYQWNIEMDDQLEITIENLRGSKVMFLIESKKGNVFGFAQHRTPFGTHKATHFISLNDPQQTAPSVFPKITNSYSFITIPKDRNEGVIVFEDAITLFDTTICRKSTFKQNYNSPFDLDFYAEFEEGQTIGLRSVQIIQWLD